MTTEFENKKIKAYNKINSLCDAEINRLRNVGDNSSDGCMTMDDVIEMVGYNFCDKILRIECDSSINNGKSIITINKMSIRLDNDIKYIILDDKCINRLDDPNNKNRSCVKSIDGLDNLDVSYVTSVKGLFSSFSSIRHLSLKNWKFSKVFDYSGEHNKLFANMDSLETLDLSGWELAKSYTMQDYYIDKIFDKTPNLKTVILKGANDNAKKTIKKALELQNLKPQIIE